MLGIPWLESNYYVVMTGICIYNIVFLRGGLHFLTYTDYLVIERNLYISKSYL